MHQTILAAVSVLVLALVVPTANAADPKPTEAAAVESGAKLRARYNLPMPSAEHQVVLYRSYEHYGRSNYSVVLWKDAQGAWQRDRVHVDGPGGLLRDLELKIFHLKAPLDPETAGALDTLLAQPSLYTETPIRTGESHHEHYELAIWGPGGKTTAEWDNELGGQLGQVVELMQDK